MAESSLRATPSNEVGAARWWLGRRHRVAEHDAASVVAGGFEAYARIFHPAIRLEAGSGRQVEVRWAEVASWSGRRFHPLAQFDCLLAGAPATPAPFDRAPGLGPLPLSQARALVEVLAASGGEPACWFGVWEGYGWLYPQTDASSAPLRRWAIPRWAISAARAAGQVMPWTSGWRLSVLVARAPRTRVRPQRRPAREPDRPKVHTEIRDYLLYRGPVDAALLTPDDVVVPRFIAAVEGWADLWWPEDHAWLLAGDTDLDSTYLGGSQTLVDAVLACPGLEALPIRVGDQVTADSDALNT